ncbi:MAG: right-handed parallel beta-helix repeat-containing protein [Pyrinomonadaceae bacterium]|nr:right-handed parallel beta-helix repeat-containing protein [Phycisphaerales bacterium]
MHHLPTLLWLGGLLIPTMASAQPVTKSNPALPIVTVTSDNTLIDKSCRVVIPPGTIIADANDDGVIHITGSSIQVEFAPGSVLRGSALDAAPDTYKGTGIRLNGQANVVISGAVVQGYKAGLWASKSPGITIERCNASDNFRQRLRSTPEKEDLSDWLYPHHNDKNEHLTNYGSAFYIEDSHHVTVRSCIVHQGQNALILRRVDDSRFYDNDFSFNSGWGIFLFRSSRNIVSRNSLDFCIRGYSHGVYNRGQDSAGVLLFEQSSNNTIAGNSATHGGDGMFAFAGTDALGENWYKAEQERVRKETGKQDVSSLIQVPADVAARHKRLGCNDNIIISNDFSYAAAHGLELTFSFGNSITSNLIRHNGICGIWAGYSQDTLIGANNLTGNGPKGSTGEGGGVNIEHGAGNRLLGNRFSTNSVGIKLWDDDDGDLLRYPWAVANHLGSVNNAIRTNIFQNDEVGVILNKTKGTKLTMNSFQTLPQNKQIVADEGSDVVNEQLLVSHSYVTPKYEILGEARPVSRRPELAGRDKIVMTEWGPWDHKQTLVRRGRTSGAGDGTHVYELFALPSRDVQVETSGEGVTATLSSAGGQPRVLTVVCDAPGIRPYSIKVTSGQYSTELKGVFVKAEWSVKVFQTPDYGAGKPPPSLEEWRALAAGPAALSARLSGLSLRYGHGGPSQVKLSDEITQARLKPDHFGTIASTRLLLTKGAYRITTISDDGVRVLVNGKTVIDRWNWHAPQTDTAQITIDADGEVPIVVEHFEIDGYSTLEFAIEPVR